MSKTTSDRHTGILNGYMNGESRFKNWAEERLGMLALTRWSWGQISMDWPVDDRFIMPDGVMFGGHIASVADHVVGLAAMTVLEDETERFRTSKLETNFFRPITKVPISVEGRVVNASKSLIHVEADFLNPEQKLCVRIAAIQVRGPVKERR